MRRSVAQYQSRKQRMLMKMEYSLLKFSCYFAVPNFWYRTRWSATLSRHLTLMKMNGAVEESVMQGILFITLHESIYRIRIPQVLNCRSITIRAGSLLDSDSHVLSAFVLDVCILNLICSVQHEGTYLKSKTDGTLRLLIAFIQYRELEWVFLANMQV